MISKLSQNGKMACILANGSLSASGVESDIRKNFIENDLVDCIISMPAQLFYTVAIPCSIWIINRNKTNKGKTLFINANKMGKMVTKKLRELSKTEIEKISGIYHAFENNDNYNNETGLCYVATKEEISQCDYVLTPGRYVGVEEEIDESINKNIDELTKDILKEFDESHILENELIENLKSIGVNI